MMASALLAALLQATLTPTPLPPWWTTPEPTPDWTATRGAWETAIVGTANAADTVGADDLHTWQAVARGTPHGWPHSTGTPTTEPTPTAVPAATATNRPYTVTPGPSPTSRFTRGELIATWTASAATVRASWTRTPTGTATATLAPTLTATALATGRAHPSLWLPIALAPYRRHGGRP